MRYALALVILLTLAGRATAQSADVIPARTSVHLLNAPHSWQAGGDTEDTITVHTFARRGIVLRAVAVVDTGFVGIDSLQYSLTGDGVRVLSYVPPALPGDDIVYQEWEGWPVTAGDVLRLVLYGITEPVTGQIRLFIIWQEL